MYHQGSGAAPSPIQRHGGGTCGIRPEKPIQGGQAGGLGNDPGPNGSFFVRLRPKTTTYSPPPPTGAGGGGLGAKKETETEMANTDQPSHPGRRRTAPSVVATQVAMETKEMDEKVHKEHQPSARGCQRRRRTEAFGCPLKQQRQRAQHPTPTPRNQVVSRELGGRGGPPLLTIRLTKKRGHNSTLFVSARKKDRVPRNLCPIFFRASATSTICPSCTKGGNGFRWK